MVDLHEIFRKTVIFKNLEQTIKDGANNIFLRNSTDVYTSLMVCLLCKKISKNLIIVVPNEIVGNKIVNDLNKVFNEELAVLFKPRELIFRNIDASSKEYEHQRLKIVYDIISKVENKTKIIVAPIESLHQIIISPNRYKDLLFNLNLGQTIKMEHITNKLIELGYVNSYQVDGIGQFSVRGEILDIFLPHLEYPVRIDFWDDEIDNIFLFDVQTQKKIGERLEKISISPVSEVVIKNKNKLIETISNLKNSIEDVDVKNNINKDIECLNNGILPENLDKYLPFIFEEKSTIIDYLAEPIILFIKYNEIQSASQSIWWHYTEDITTLLEDKVLTKQFENHILSLSEIENKIKNNTKIFSSLFDDVSDKNNIEKIINCSHREVSSLSSNINLLNQDVESYINDNYKVVVLTGSKSISDFLSKNFIEKGYNVVNKFENLVKGSIIFLDISLSVGVESVQDSLVLISLNNSYNLKKRYNKLKNNKNLISISSTLENISIGDYIVHVDHGIGIFDGINKLELQGVIKDYIKIRYSGSDILYVPVTQLDLVSKYIGNSEDKIIKLNKLNSTDWQKKRIQVKNAVKDIAKDLIKVQSERLNSKGYQFSKDTDWQNQFEDLFEYQETEAQLRCIDEIKEDMEKTYPMDRLLCGDVGVGKTEVALRMAFKAVMDGKQVAVLAPTTILTWQHYNTFKSRLNNFPIKIDLLSRLKTPAQQKNIIKKLKSGEIEIIIGTHRLLQKDVEFKDIGLLIIDEEQRFGVSDKEKIKKIKNNVDILTLSATPIPRTLNMAMNGMKDISIIDEPPQDRLPIQTYVLEYDENIISMAILKEMKRGGMVFYLHNNIETIEKVATKIANLIPDIRILIAHGRMSQTHLTEIWEQILNHNADILICTTIIETGIDVPFCNTLIVENADRMGLAQLHQLRGRIGRANKRAYAYMTYPKGKALSDVSTKRLLAIKEYTKFGAGFKIALRDLEIRGAGNVLGAQQHGHIESVGYDMYVKLLSEAVAEEQGKKPDLLVSEECTIDIETSAYLPEYYIKDLSNRIDIYKKIAMVKIKEEYDELIDELVDRFGLPPKEVMNLLNISLSRNLAIKNNIKEISQKGDYIYIYQDPLNIEFINSIPNKIRERVVINTNNQPSIKIKVNKKEDKLSLLIDIFSIL